MVHNLGAIQYNQIDSCFDWANQFDTRVVENIQDRNHEQIVQILSQGELSKLAHPTLDHFLPLLYVLGASEIDDQIHVFNQKCFAGSITMTSLRIG
jgi:4,5-DOPA dioxygenase extradiol